MYVLFGWVRNNGCNAWSGVVYMVSFLFSIIMKKTIGYALFVWHSLVLKIRMSTKCILPVSCNSFVNFLEDSVLTFSSPHTIHNDRKFAICTNYQLLSTYFIQSIIHLNRNRACNAVLIFIGICASSTDSSIYIYIYKA